MFRGLSTSTHYEVFASARSSRLNERFDRAQRDKIVTHLDVENIDALSGLFADVRPDVVINCIGLVKQLAGASDPTVAIPINSLLPHRLARLCGLVGARLIHISTDCVFDGAKGNYSESDIANAADVYGRTKLLGEVDYPHAVTLRTSIIGRELDSAHGLVDWFLKQTGQVKGFTNAIFSGVTTVELMRIIREFVLPRDDLHGLYHVSAAAISKHDLLKILAEAYDKDIEIVPDGELRINRSLDSSRFRTKTGYNPPGWPELVVNMRDFG